MCRLCLPTIEDVNSQRLEQTEAFPSVLATETVQHNVHTFWRNPEAANGIKQTNISTSERGSGRGKIQLLWMTAAILFFFF